ncbi:MAG: PilZ domain-containing protein [Pseudobdellovibrionaceae bacterium]
MTNRWYLLLDGHVVGPMTESEIDQKVTSPLDPVNQSETLIWGKGFPEWVQYSQWKTEKNQILQEESVKSPKDPLWKYKSHGITSQWMALSELLQSLKQLDDISQTQVSRDDNDSWRDVYQVAQLVDHLGITRRAHPRVPIMGTLEMELPTGAITARVISISEGGVGITDVRGVSLGQKFKAQLKSPNLFATINCNCEVVYVGQDGYAGIKFHNLNSEYHGAIIEYVKKFADLKMI